MNLQRTVVLECVCGCGKTAFAIADRDFYVISHPQVAMTEKCLARYEKSMEAYLEKQVDARD